MSPTAFIALVLPPARAAALEFGVPVSITLAQAALESGWGSRAIGNNLFGIKADKSWTGASTLVDTHEYVNGKRVPLLARFRLYKTLDDGVRDHAKFIKENKRYTPCFKETTGAGWARALQKAGYATDPSYADLLISIMDGRKLTQYDAK